MRERPLLHALKEAGKALLLVVGLGLMSLVCQTQVCDWTRHDQARLDLHAIEGGIRLYVCRKGQLPPTLHDIVQARILEAPPLDPWNSEYLYAVDGGRVALTTLGADVEPGGEDGDSDLTHSFNVTVRADAGPSASCRSGEH